MTATFRILYSVAFLAILFLIQFTYTQGYSSQPNWYDAEDEQFSLWKMLEALPDNQEVHESVDDEYELDDLPDDQSDFFERSVDYPARRSVPHKKCKIIKHPIHYREDGFEYRPKYENLTCVETDDDPFNINPPHEDQYCYIFHHAHSHVSCKAKYREVPLFRRRNMSRFWELHSVVNITVGCACSLGFTYVY